jgi:hypothetical protein
VLVSEAIEVAMVKEMLSQMDELEKEGLKMINLYNCWLGQRLVSLATWADPMRQYTRQNNPTRFTTTLWSAAKYAVALKKITMASSQTSRRS